MTTPKMPEYLMGFDLGGTKMMATVFDGKHNIVGRQKRKTQAEKGAEVVLERMKRTIREACTEAGIEPDQLGGIGVGSPGPLDPYEGVIIFTPNLGFRNFPLRAELEEAFGVPVIVENDVNAGTYGEFHFGAAKGLRHVVGVFPGTGIGGGIIINGELYRGANGSAGEVGHCIIQPDGPLCGCGQRGCLEAVSSKSALAKDATALLLRGRAPGLAKLVGKKMDDIKSGVLGEAYREGDPDIVELVNYAAKYLGMSLANLVNIFNPDAILLGGGIIEAMPPAFVKKTDEAMRQYSMPFNCKGVKMIIAKLGDDAVVFGAVRLIAEKIGLTETTAKTKSKG